MMADFGLETMPHLYVDASAAIGICQRKGLGKVRHLDTRSLWIRDALRQKRLGIQKVLGTENPSDAMTKFLDGVALSKMLGLMRCRFLEGRPESAPQLAVDVSKHSADQDTHLSHDDVSTRQCNSVQLAASIRPADQPQSRSLAAPAAATAESSTAAPLPSSSSSSRHSEEDTRPKEKSGRAGGHRASESLLRRHGRHGRRTGSRASGPRSRSHEIRGQGGIFQHRSFFSVCFH